jgi:hypothetical protein
VRLDTISTKDVGASHLDWCDFGMLVRIAEVISQAYRTSLLLSCELSGGPYNRHGMRTGRRVCFALDWAFEIDFNFCTRSLQRG